MAIDRKLWEDVVNEFEHGESSIALRMLIPIAEHGNAEAQNMVGIIFSGHHHRIQAYGTLSDEEELNENRIDIEKAIAWFTKASEQGYGPASHNLAMLYLENQDVLVGAKEKVQDLLQVARQQNAAYVVLSTRTEISYN